MPNAFGQLYTLRDHYNVSTIRTNVFKDMSLIFPQLCHRIPIWCILCIADTLKLDSRRLEKDPEISFQETSVTKLSGSWKSSDVVAHPLLRFISTRHGCKECLIELQ